MKKVKIILPDNTVRDRILKKKFYCSKCKEDKNDIEVIWVMADHVICSKCGKKISKVFARLKKRL